MRDNGECEVPQIGTSPNSRPSKTQWFRSLYGWFINSPACSFLCLFWPRPCAVLNGQVSVHSHYLSFFFYPCILPRVNLHIFFLELKHPMNGRPPFVYLRFKSHDGTSSLHRNRTPQVFCSKFLVDEWPALQFWQVKQLPFEDPDDHELSYGFVLKKEYHDIPLGLGSYP